VALEQWKQSLVSLVQHNKKSKLEKMSLRKVVHLGALQVRPGKKGHNRSY
jgi:regulator of replication initiation timing